MDATERARLRELAASIPRTPWAYEKCYELRREKMWALKSPDSETRIIGLETLLHDIWIKEKTPIMEFIELACNSVLPLLDQLERMERDTSRLRIRVRELEEDCVFGRNEGDKTGRIAADGKSPEVYTRHHSEGCAWPNCTCPMRRGYHADSSESALRGEETKK